MVEFKISLNISKPLDVVWDAFINPDNMLRWTKYLEKVETVQGKFGEIGAVSHLHYLEKGKSYILEDKLLEYEESKRIKSQVSGQGMIIEVDTTFSHDLEETIITMNWKSVSTSKLVKIMLKIARKRIVKNAQEELIHFKSLVETHGKKFP